MSSVLKKSIEDRGPAASAGRDDDLPVSGRPIDLVHLARQSLGDRALETELLVLFDRQAAQIMAQISGASPSSDRKFVGDLAHTLKGSARAVGAIGVAAAARAYEDGLETGNINGRLDKLAGTVAEARAAIADLLTER